MREAVPVFGSGRREMKRPVKICRGSVFAKAVITDSGGIQEETTYLKIPCFTLRKDTERPITIRLGSNRLVGDDLNILVKSVTQLFQADRPRRIIPPLWDGFAAGRIRKQLTLCQKQHEMKPVMKRPKGFG